MSRLMLILMSMLIIPSAHAWDFRAGIAGGSAGLGNGHPNAADFRSVNNYKVHASFKNTDISVAPTQFMVGRVFEFALGSYVIPAAGIIVNANGMGGGFGASFGWSFFCIKICTYIEFQNLIGAGMNRQLVTGSAARIGIDYSR